MTHAKQLLGLAGIMLLTFAAAALGAYASANAGSFYLALARPAWAPPAWLFAPVWSVLYLLMGFAAWLVWGDRGFRGASVALTLYGLQLLVNALWTWLFFVWHQGAWSLVEIAVLWALILGTIIAFWRVKPIAGLLLLPYLAWVSFASVLTLAVWRLNPQTLSGFDF